MALIKYNTGDGGTNGTAVTTGNSGGASGNAWGNVTGGTNTWQYVNTPTVKGGMAYRVTQQASTAAGMEMTLGGNYTTHYGRAYIYMSAFATTEHSVIRGYALTYIDAWRIGLTATGQLRMRGRTGTLLGTTTQTISLNTWWRIEWRVVNADAASQITVNVYNGDMTTPAFSYTNNACDLESETIAVQFGPSLSTPTVPTMYFDEIATDNAAFVGAANVVNQPPTANAGPDQNALEGSIVTLDASSSNDSDGTIASYAWTQTGGTAVTLSSNSVARPTFTAPLAGSVLTFQVTVTDSGSLTASDTVVITTLSSLLRYNRAEGGTDGTVVDTTNSGGFSGDAWNSVSVGGAWTFTTTARARGALAYSCSQPSGSGAIIGWDVPAITNVYGRCYMYFTGFASAAQIIIRAFSSNFSNEAWRIDLQSTGVLRIRDADTTILATAPQALTPGVWYRMEWHIISGVSNGTLEFRVYTADQNTPLFNYSNTACNTNVSMDHYQFGPSASNTQLPVMYADEFALGQDGWIGTAAGTPLNAPPTANAGADQNAAMSASVTLDGSASSDPDGTIASYAWTQTGGTTVTLSSATVAKPTFTAPAGAGALTFQLTVTDNNGATGTDSVVINVLASIIKQNSASGGTGGGNVTTGNSGGASGTAWDAVTGGTGVWKYTNGLSARSPLGYQCDMIASTAAVLQWTLPALTEYYGRLYFNFVGFGTAVDSLVRPFVAGFSTNNFRIEINTTRRLVVRDNTSVRYTSTDALAADVWYRLEWHVITSTTVGVLEMRLYIADQTTPLLSYTSSGNLNTGAESSAIQFGPSLGNSMNPAAPRKYFDEITIGAASGGWIGKAAGQDINQTPIANAGADVSLEPHTVYSLQGTATDDGTIAQWSWRQISGTPVALSSANAQNPSFTTPAVIGGDTLVFGLIVTDERGGISSEDTVSIRVLTPTVLFARNGAWVG